MNTRRFTNPAMLVVSGLAVIALAACSGGHSSTPHPSASASGAIDTRTAWLAVANCMRANGYPNFPDPVQDGNVWLIPDSGSNIKAPDACAQLVGQAKKATTDANRPSAADMAKYRDYAKCMRDQGVHNFPDPDENGDFNVPEDIRGTAAVTAAHNACKHYLPPQPPK
jgi:hypothetical protein